MKFVETAVHGARLVEIEPIGDERGFFARSWCEREFAEQGLNPALVQCNISYNARRGTLRGMHYQAEPHAEAKLIRCTRGRIYDVLIDLRADSPTYKQWYAVELTPNGGRMLYAPEGVAHGFQSLEDDTEVFYQMSEFYHPDSARGVRWDDPAFGIDWPEGHRILSERDRMFPDFAG